jgi:ribonuclease R
MIARRYVATVEDGGVVHGLFGQQTDRLAGPEDPPASGDVVVVEVDQGRARVEATLARAGSTRAGIYAIAARFGLDPIYPPEVHAEARGFQARPGLDDPVLADLTGLPFVTIDNPDSRDLDQALHVERDGDGFVVRYALADASYYVRPGDALFAEALVRGASYYLPGLTVPMLPRSLSEGLVSLNQGQLRRSLVLVMRLDRDGAPVDTAMVRARVQSARKLSYPRVQAYYRDPAGSGWLAEPWRQSLDLLREVGTLRIDAARRRHVVTYHRAEIDVKLSETETLGFRLSTAPRLEVERYNEQISLLCNVEGARLLAASRGLEQVQPIFRVHPAPSEAALGGLAAAIAELVEARALAERWRWQLDRGVPLADYLDRLPRTGGWGRVARAIERQARRLNQRSTFEAEPAPHYGIGAPVYARFSSPMREIVGVFTHKEALEALGGEAGALAVDVELRDRVVEAGNRAKEVQRQITKQAHRMVLDRLFASEAGRADAPLRTGTVMGLTGSRVYVQLDNPAVDVKVYVAHLDQQFGCGFAADREDVSLSAREPGAPRFVIGDGVRVRVLGHDAARDRWRLHMEPMRRR